VKHFCEAAKGQADLHQGSATRFESGATVDALVTDPPYYGAIPYSDLADFFYVWLRRTVGDRFPEVFDSSSVVPRGEELVQHAAYASGDHALAKRRYEEGMAQAFSGAVRALSPDGVMVVVFANKEPEAWDALVTSIIGAGCTVTGSWPIDTERTAKMGADKAAHLSTSVWLVCRGRPDGAAIGRYKEVRREMEARIGERLRYFWDLGISGPDFIWAAVGPALESYSRYKEVRRLDGQPFTVRDFLREVRRLVTDFALGQILHGASTEGLDEWTRYYLMHRASFALDSAPAGECILLAQGYNLDLNELRGPRAILAKGKPAASEEDEEEGRGGGSALRLVAWDERKRDDLGLPHPTGGLPFIDALHRATRLWAAGDPTKVCDYLDEHGLKQSDLFWTVAQAVLEMSDPKSRERTLLEALVAWGRGKQVRATAAPAQGSLFTGGSTT
jgi:adenine-specific DNA methylase